MKTRIYSALIVLLLVLLVIAIGLPHGKDHWFAYWFSSESDREMQYKLLTVFRIPELIMAVVSGTALAVCGLLLQTFLNNPLAGPSILGLTSGSNLLVAITIMGGSFFNRIFIIWNNFFSSFRSFLIWVNHCIGCNAHQIIRFIVVNWTDARNFCYGCNEFNHHTSRCK